MSLSDCSNTRSYAVCMCEWIYILTASSKLIFAQKHWSFVCTILSRVNDRILIRMDNEIMLITIFIPEIHIHHTPIVIANHTRTPWNPHPSTRHTHKYRQFDNILPHRAFAIRIWSGERDDLRAVQGRPFQCLQCPAAFCRKPYLDIHMRMHTGERPFQCDLCMKRFTQKSSLNIHKRIHTGRFISLQVKNIQLLLLQKPNPTTSPHKRIEWVSITTAFTHFFGFSRFCCYNCVVMFAIRCKIDILNSARSY